MSRGISFGLAAFLAVTTVVFAAPWLAQADEPPEPPESQAEVVDETDAASWELSARIRPRAESRFNHHFGLAPDELDRPFQPDEAGLITQQSRLGAGVDIGEISGRLTLQHSAVWGAFGGDELTVPPLNLYEGWFRYEPGATIAIDAGRFELAYGGERVLGAVGWSQVGRTWDGLRTVLRPHDTAQIDVFAARYDEHTATFGHGDAYLTGAYASMDQPFSPLVDTADLYLLGDMRIGEPPADVPQQSDQSANQQAESHRLMMLGSLWRLQSAGWDLTTEGAFQLGARCPQLSPDGDCAVDEQPLRAWFVDAETGFRIGATRPFAGFSYATGDDPDTDVDSAYTGMYPTGHAVLGYMDLIGPRTNLMEFRAGLQVEFDEFRTQLAAHNFTRPQPENARLGTEFNTKLFVDLTDSLQIGTGHGLFLPAEGMSLTDETPRGLANWSFAQATGTF